MRADRDADPEQGERRNSEHDASPVRRAHARNVVEADVADRHGQWTVVPRFSKKLMIAGAAPTMNAETAEMIVPLRPSAEWW